jgi:hypothetical protein
MTDEQLERIARRAEMTLCPENRHTWDGELATGCLALIADYRRLRDLERACKQLFWQDEHGAYWMSKSEYWKADERCAADTIGRLLEGEG